MSTPATVSFRENGSEMVSLYCHWDGYPSGFGAELADFFKGITVVNGFNASQEKVGAFANGFGCAVAQFIASVKTMVGNIYVQVLGTCDGDYDYVIDYSTDNHSYLVSAVSYGEEIFKGDIYEFWEFCRADEEQ